MAQSSIGEMYERFLDILKSVIACVLTKFVTVGASDPSFVTPLRPIKSLKKKRNRL